MRFDTVIGFVPADAGIMLCADCAADDIASEDESRGSVIFPASETDSPSHCDECGALIPETLTDDGVAYVAEAFAEYIGAAVFVNADGSAKHGGSASTLDAWREAFAADLYEHNKLLATFDDIRERETAKLEVFLVSCEGYGRLTGMDSNGCAWTESILEEGTPDDCAICGASVSDGWLCMDGGDVVCVSHVVTPSRARSIAADWHDGQASEFYKVASSGSATAYSLEVAKRELRAIDVPTKIREGILNRPGHDSGWNPHAYNVPRILLDERWKARNELRALVAWIDGARSYGYAEALLAIYGVMSSPSASDSFKLARVRELLASAGLEA